MQNSLENKINEYLKTDPLPMHMPGHKRNQDFIGPAFAHDLTEIAGFDNLHKPEGILKDIANKVSAIYKSKYSYISVNGSTSLILSAIYAASPKKIAVALNCHISVWNAIELTGSDVVILEPELTEYPFAGKISPSEVEKAFENNPDIGAVVITSPTYEGLISDTKAIYEIVKKHGALFICDEAHGAHLGLDEYFGQGASCDIGIKSLHKTLNSPTGTAVMNVYSDLIDRDRLNHATDIFETTSPSYILMEGIAGCVESISPGFLKPWEDGLESIEQKINSLKYIEHVAGTDKSKLVFLCNGEALAQKLRTDFNIECEAAFPTHLIAMTGVGDTRQSLERFADALIKCDLPEFSAGASKKTVRPKPLFSKSIRDAARAKHTKIDTANAVGKVCGELIFKEPPGIPAALPGEILTAEVLANVDAAQILVCLDD